MSSFIRKSIGELCDIGGGEVKTGPFGSQLHQADYSDEGTPVVMPTDIFDGGIREERIVRVSESHVYRLAKHKLSKGDIVYGRRGDIGRQALIRDSNVGWLCGTGCLRITIGDSEVIPEYLHLYLKMPEIIGLIQNQAIGATMPNLNTQILRRIPVCYPSSKSEQKKIVSLVFAFDDLIENNKRRIALLENIAEEIYREWFVRFRFPNYKNAEFEKGIPKGWEVKSLGEFYNTASGGTPSRSNSNNYGGEINWLKTGELKNTFAFDSDEKITLQGLESSSTKIFPPYTVVIAMYCAMPYITILAEKSSTNQACCAFLPKYKYLSHVYTYHLIKFAQNHMIQFAHGAAQQNLSQDLIKGFTLLIASDSVVTQFTEKVVPIFEQIKLLAKMNKQLERTKNSLLPRLISGKLTVENLNIQFPPSMVEAEIPPNLPL